MLDYTVYIYPCLTSRIKNNQIKGILILNRIKSKETNNLMDDVRLGLTFKFLLLHDNEINAVLLSSKLINTAKKDWTYHPLSSVKAWHHNLKTGTYGSAPTKVYKSNKCKYYGRWKFVINVFYINCFIIAITVYLLGTV